VIGDLKPYAEYKDSGLPWLGHVPGHWWVRPAFGAFKPNKARNIGMKEKTVLSLSYGRIVIKPAEKLHGLVPESFETYQIVDPGDIVLRTTDLQNDHTSLRVGMVRDRGIITSAYLALRALSGVSPDYGFQFLNVWDSSKAIYGYGSGLRQNLDFSHFKRMLIPIPPPEEQAAIVRFLDWANGRLERAIRAKQKVIALLNEQKQAIIHRAVTRGLDPSVPLKDSGVPWLGEIPKHWEPRRLKSMLARNDGGVWGSDFAPDGTIVLRSTEQAMDGSWQINDPAVIRLSDSQVKSALLEVGDIVVTKSSGSPSHIGKASLVTREIAEMRCCYANFMQRLRTAHELAPEYLNLFLNSKTGRMHYQYSSTSTTGLGNLTRETIATLPIPVPDRSEQAHVLDGVQQRLKPIDEAISRLEREITLLREYCTRLVADVVTGKLDVREAATRLPDEELLSDLGAEDDEPDELPIEEEDDA